MKKWINGDDGELSEACHASLMDELAEVQSIMMAAAMAEHVANRTDTGGPAPLTKEQ